MAKRSGLTYVEVVLSTLLVGILGVTTMTASSFHVRNARKISDMSLAINLADRLLAEIAELRHSETPTTTALGADAGELTSNRLTWDDIDDANNYFSNPPKDRLNVTRENLANWSESVRVRYVDPVTLGYVSTPTDLKHIRVRITLPNGQQFALRRMMLAPGSEDPLANSGNPVNAIELRSTNFPSAPGSVNVLPNRPIP
jgi:type II secretory pathway pseudopilin PulG